VDSTATPPLVSEKICQPNPNQYALFPIHQPKLWKMYKQHVASFWTTEEVDLSADLRDWGKMNENEKYFISMVLAFFASSDGE
jgi:ribonucleoside-diphosphate reductase beta chain